MAGQLEMFKEIWSERDHISFLSKRSLKYFDVKMFAHILPKGRYTKFKLKKFNIILLHPEEHNLLDQGTVKQREAYAKLWNCNWDKVYELKEELLKNYKNE
jgi:hypothetical protein